MCSQEVQPVEAAEALDRSFTSLLSTNCKTWSSSDCISPCPSTGPLGHNQKSALKIAKNLFDVCQRQLQRCFSLMRKTSISTLLYTSRTTVFGLLGRA